jgi:hypothetical protein
MTRFWELFAGVLLALWERKKTTPFPNLTEKISRSAEKIARALLFRIPPPPGQTAAAARSALSMLGFLLIALALFKAKTNGFPGKQALVPVLGSLCVIAAGTQAWLNKILLARKPIVYLGLISYPLYLWHWPLLSYSRIILGEMPHRDFRIALLLLSVSLASLTYHLIEKPIRFSNKNKTTKIAALCALMTTLAIAGGEIWRHKGYKHRWVVDKIAQSQRFQILQAVRERFPRAISANDHAAFKTRYGWPASFPNNPGMAMFRDVGGKQTVLFFGDSHSGHAYFSVADHNAEIGVNTVTMGSVWFFDKTRPSFIEGLRDFYWNAIKNDLSIRKIFILTRRFHFTQADIDALSRPGVKIYMVADNPFIADPGFSNYALLQQLDRYLGEIHPLCPKFLASCQKTESAGFAFLHRSRAEATKEYEKHLENLRALKGVTLIEGTVDAFCGKTECPFFDEQGYPLYWDWDHITYLHGAKRLVDKVLRPYLDEPS